MWLASQLLPLNKALLAGLELGITPAIPQEVAEGSGKSKDNKNKRKSKDSNDSNITNSSSDNRNSNNPHTTNEYTEDEGKFTKGELVKIEEADPQIVQDLIKKSEEVAQVLKIATNVTDLQFRNILNRTQRQHF